MVVLKCRAVVAFYINKRGTMKIVFDILVSVQKIFLRSRVSTSSLSCVQSFFMPRLSCVWSYLCPDYRVFKLSCVQTIVRSFVFPDRVILNARHPLAISFWSGHIDIRSGTSGWENFWSVLVAQIAPILPPAWWSQLTPIIGSHVFCANQFCNAFGFKSFSKNYTKLLH